MASAWGSSWGSAWGNSWGSVAAAAAIGGRRRRRGRKLRIWTDEQLQQPDPLAPPERIEENLASLIEARAEQDRSERIATLEARLESAEKLTKSLRKALIAEIQRLKDEEEDEEAALLLLS